MGLPSMRWAHFVADNAMPRSKKMTPAGLVTTFAGSATSSGSVDGTGGSARFGRPTGLAIDAADNLYVTI